MSKIETAGDAEKIVNSYYLNPMGPRPSNFDVHKQGRTWVVKFNIPTGFSIAKHEWHIDSGTGNVLNKK
ncbi:hypothetical protein JP09_004695 [Dehalogenimonas etheniformans]|uniref:PepSY domain-containing protein n=1 Tax=Dehalogenimonas etheniformans TaxID=1536648 RepID=A0A2P5P7Y3_9CHLR|nr:hypothetical protein JP09_004695 [Dehalogenimonas etheniformans]